MLFKARISISSSLGSETASSGTIELNIEPFQVASSPLLFVIQLLMSVDQVFETAALKEKKETCIGILFV